MKLDRDLQLAILNKFAPHYPNPAQLGDWDCDRDVLTANLFYLVEHDLLNAALLRTTDSIKFGNIRLTKNGMDFLAGDGGLSAILGVVTVRLHDETIRDLVAARIQDSDLSPEDKTGLLHQLRGLRGESIKHLTMKLLDAGLANLPAAIPIIQKALGGIL